MERYPYTTQHPLSTMPLPPTPAPTPPPPTIPNNNINFFNNQSKPAYNPFSAKQALRQKLKQLWEDERFDHTTTTITRQPMNLDTSRYSSDLGRYWSIDEERRELRQVACIPNERDRATHQMAHIDEHKDILMSLWKRISFEVNEYNAGRDGQLSLSESNKSKEDVRATRNPWFAETGSVSDEDLISLIRESSPVLNAQSLMIVIRKWLRPTGRRLSEKEKKAKFAQFRILIVNQIKAIWSTPVSVHDSAPIDIVSCKFPER